MKMYSVVHRDHILTASVKPMGSTRKRAIEMWELWNSNQGTIYNKECQERGWIVQAYDVLPIKVKRKVEG